MRFIGDAITQNIFLPFRFSSPPPNNNGLPFLPAMQPVFFDVPPFGGPPGPFYAPFGHMYPMYQPPFGYVPPHAAHQQQMFPYPAAAAN